MFGSLADFPPPSRPDYLISSAANEYSRQFLTAGNSLSEILADGGFSSLFLESLSLVSADTNRDQYITANEVISYVRNNLIFKGGAYQSQPEQRTIGGNGDFVFGPLRPGELPVLPAMDGRDENINLLMPGRIPNFEALRREKVRYFSKKADNGVVESTLRSQSVNFSTMSSTLANPTNVLVCWNNPDLNALKELAKLLVANGIGIKAVRKTDYGESGAITIQSLIYLNDAATLTSEDIEKINGCGPEVLDDPVITNNCSTTAAVYAQFKLLAEGKSKVFFKEMPVGSQWRPLEEEGRDLNNVIGRGYDVYAERRDGNRWYPVFEPGRHSSAIELPDSRRVDPTRVTKPLRLCGNR